MQVRTMHLAIVCAVAPFRPVAAFGVDQRLAGLEMLDRAGRGHVADAFDLVCAEQEVQRVARVRRDRHARADLTEFVRPFVYGNPEARTL
jgi:hypothetical protein